MKKKAPRAEPITCKKKGHRLTKRKKHEKGVCLRGNLTQKDDQLTQKENPNCKKKRKKEDRTRQGRLPRSGEGTIKCQTAPPTHEHTLGWGDSGKTRPGGRMIRRKRKGKSLWSNQRGPQQSVPCT